MGKQDLIDQPKVSNRLCSTHTAQSKPAFLDLHVFVSCCASFHSFIVNLGTFEENLQYSNKSNSDI